MHCGWIPEEEWEPWRKPEDRAIPTQIGPSPYRLNVCPGWVVRQPAVVEAAQAYGPYEKGAMAAYYPPDVTANNVYEGAQAVAHSFNKFQNWKLKESRKDT